MAKPVVIGSRSFRTQKSALDHYKALLHRYQDGDRISDPGDHADHQARPVNARACDGGCIAIFKAQQSGNL